MSAILLKRLVGLLGLLAVCALAGSSISTFARTNGQLSAIHRSHEFQQVLHGVPLSARTTRADAEFYAAALRIMPKNTVYHLAVGSGPHCGSGLVFFGVAYQLLPRAAVCDTSAKYWVIVGAGAVAMPAGSRVLASAPGFVLVERITRGRSG